jgi:DNA-binding GntR family transcriptional regulator
MDGRAEHRHSVGASMTDDFVTPGEGTLQQRVYDRLREDIISGRVQPGAAVTIRGLAGDLGVSAMPVREALRRLVAERALVLLDNRRVRVPAMDAARFEDLLSARMAIEGEAAERALKYIDRDRLACLGALDDQLDAARAMGEVETWITANFAFHRTLYEARPGSVFMPLIESLWLQLGPFMRTALETLDHRYVVDRHDEALKAIRLNDAKALRRAIENDIYEGIGHVAMLPGGPAVDA